MSTAPVSAPLPSASEEGAILIGPQSAGKTTLLGSLELASRVTSFPGLGRVGVFPGNDGCTQLFDNARMIGKLGRIEFPGTVDPEEYLINLRYTRPRKWLFFDWGGSAFTYPFKVIDGRGGDSIGAADESHDEGRRRTLVTLAARCRGLIICVDANDRLSTGHFFQSLNRFLRDVTTVAGGNLPFHRVAIVLTKADRLVESDGPSAEGRLAARDPVPHTRELIGLIALSDLFTHLSQAARQQVCCGWASVYGFIPQDGAVNFISGPDGGRLAVYRDGDARWINFWKPHQVLDPFVYIATGIRAGLRTLPDPLTPAN